MAGRVKLDGVYVISGAASLEVESGYVEVLGTIVDSGERIVVPAGRKIPVRFRQATVTIVGGVISRGSVEVYEAMGKAAMELSRLEGRILLLGPSDSGKSTLAAWAASLAGASLLTVDVGQNEYYAPAFESLIKAKPPIIPGLPKMELSTCFVGSFTPSKALARYISCASRLARMATTDTLLIDTDGWIAPPDGMAAKASLAESLNVDYVVPVAMPRDAGETVARIAGARVPMAIGSLSVSRKSPEERRLHRERLIAARVVGGSSRLLDADRLALLGSPVFNCDQIYLAVKGIVYAESCENSTIVITQRRLPFKPPRTWRVLHEGWERGRIAAILDESGNHNLAIVEKVNYRRRAIVVKTLFEGKARALLIGEAKVSLNLGD